MNQVQRAHKSIHRHIAQVVFVAFFALSPSLAHAQGSPAGIGEIAPIVSNSPLTVDRNGAGSVGFPLPSVAPPQFWASADLLLWHASGIPGGNSGTPLGGRFGTGMWLDPEQHLGLEASGLFLNGRSDGLAHISGIGETSSPLSRFSAVNPAAGIDHPSLMRLYENGAHEAQHYFNTRPMGGGGLGQPVLSGPWPAALGEHHRRLEK